jgi:hypothetical protein
MLGVGSEATEVTPADVLAGFQKSGGLSTLVNAIDLRLSAMKLEGEAKYFDGLEEGWNSLREKGFQGLRIRWGTSMEDIAKGWDQISKGELKPEEGLVFLL